MGFERVETMLSFSPISSVAVAAIAVAQFVFAHSSSPAKGVLLPLPSVFKGLPSTLAIGGVLPSDIASFLLRVWSFIAFLSSNVFFFVRFQRENIAEKEKGSTEKRLLRKDFKLFKGPLEFLFSFL